MASTEKHHGGASHGSLKEYAIGLLLCIALTAFSFGIVMTEAVSGTTAVIVILITAVAQIMVQLVFFLHMNTSSDQIWNNTSAIFVVVLVAILIVGSVWIMAHLNHNMMMGH